MQEKITAIFREALGSPAVDENTDPSNIDKWDSISHLHLIVALEDELDVSFEPEEIEEMRSLKIIQEVIEKKLGKKTN
jgi:acyl carrier protein